MDVLADLDVLGGDDGLRDIEPARRRACRLRWSIGLRALGSDGALLRHGKPDNTFTTNDEYQHFIDEQVSPRFRDGFTVFEGRGQYLDPKGRMWREPTKVLVLMYPPDASKSTAIDQIRNAYKTEFRQEAVMRVDGTTCVAF
jgi:hypothetical protein